MQILSGFLDMSGYGFYVWTSYFFSFLLIGMLAFSVISRKNKIKVKLDTLHKTINRENK